MFNIIIHWNEFFSSKSEKIWKIQKLVNKTAIKSAFRGYVTLPKKSGSFWVNFVKNLGPQPKINLAALRGMIFQWANYASTDSSSSVLLSDAFTVHHQRRVLNATPMRKAGLCERKMQIQCSIVTDSDIR